MASRKDQKEAARQARIAAEQAAAAKAAQRQRYGIIGGIVAVAVIVAVVAIVISSGGSSGTSKQASDVTSTTAQATKAKTATYNAVATELKGIPQNGATLGNPKAKTTIQYFGDLECPVCQAFTLGDDNGGLPALIDGPVKQGKVKLVYKAMETASAAVNNDRFVPQQVAALAAGEQGKFWEYAELFYHEQGSEDDRYVTEAYLDGLAKQIPGLNYAKWLSDRKSAALAAQVTADGKLATSYGLQGTPTLVAIGAGSEEEVPAATGVPTFSEIQTAITAVAKKTS